MGAVNKAAQTAEPLTPWGSWELLKELHQIRGFPVPPFESLVLSLINNNNMHAPKLPPNESHKTLPGLYLQHAIDNRP